MGGPSGSCVSRLVVDFDSTCTQRDTTALYGELAAEEAEARNEHERGATIRQAWQDAGQAYMEQYEETMALALQEVGPDLGFTHCISKDWRIGASRDMFWRSLDHVNTRLYCLM